MSTPFESAQLNLQLYDLRREPLLREARAWFLRDVNPETLDELLAIIRSEKNTWFRMVLGYWDMAASLVTAGAIDAASFCAAHGEIFAAFSKVHPFLADLRALAGEPGLLQHVEKVVLAEPEAESILNRRRAAMLALSKLHRAQITTAG